MESLKMLWVEFSMELPDAIIPHVGSSGFEVTCRVVGDYFVAVAVGIDLEG